LKNPPRGIINYTNRYVWSPAYVNALVFRDTLASDSPTARIWVIQDANWNVTALVLSSSVIERFDYTPFGAVTALNAAGTGAYSGSSYNWVYLWQGGRLDAITGNLQFGFRDYSPVLMRWTTNDPDGLWGGNPNTYGMEGNGVIGALDPNGCAEFKIDGTKFFVHPYDVDPFPSKPHAHINSPNCPYKVHIDTGEIFHGGKSTGKFIGKKTLEKLRTSMRGKGLLGTAIVTILALPEIASAAEQGGAAGAATATGGIVKDTVNGVATTGIVGGLTVIGADLAGTTVTGLGGAAIGTGGVATAVGGAVAAGGAITLVAAGGVAAGTAISQINVGGQTLSGETTIAAHTADGLIEIGQQAQGVTNTATAVANQTSVGGIESAIVGIASLFGAGKGAGR